MLLYDFDKKHYPRRWADMSVDLRSMFIHHCCMMVLMVVAPSSAATDPDLTLAGVVLFEAAFLSVAVAISLRHRRAINWRWQGAGWKQVLSAIVAAALTGFFGLASSAFLPPLAGAKLPIMLAILGFAVLFVLQALQLTDLSEIDFVAIGRPAESAETPKELWKRAVRGGFAVLWLLVWLAGVGGFYLHGRAIRDGSPVPTVEMSEAIKDRGHVTYVSASDKRYLDLLAIVPRIGIPAAIVLGLFIHFVLGVTLFPRFMPSIFGDERGMGTRTKND